MQQPLGYRNAGRLVSARQLGDVANNITKQYAESLLIGIPGCELRQFHSAENV
jgi:hypothetical protein